MNDKEYVEHLIDKYVNIRMSEILFNALALDCKIGCNLMIAPDENNVFHSITFKGYYDEDEENISKVRKGLDSCFSEIGSVKSNITEELVSIIMENPDLVPEFKDYIGDGESLLHEILESEDFAEILNTDLLYTDTKDRTIIVLEHLNQILVKGAEIENVND
jgi:hypothetical protein